ncbi:DMT family transporter [Candidatus Pacearchaeota archaeon]|nr:DMT family transporter [Candidatus Pacearchaeota archaeon]
MVEKIKIGIFLAILSAILLSLSYIFFAILLKDESISKILFYWFLIAFIFSLFFGIKKRKQIFKEIKSKSNPLIIVGLIEGLAAIFFLNGLKTIGPVLTSFIVQFVFIFVLIYSLIFLKEKFKLLEFFGIIIAIVGVFIINWNQELSIVKGSFLMLIVAFLFATSSFIAKKYINEISPKTINLVRLFFIALFGLFYTFIKKTDLVLNLDILPLIVGGSFLCAFLGFEFFYNSLKYIKLGTSNLLRTLTPIFTIFFAFVILSEIPTFIKIFGSFLILIGVLFLIKNGKNKNNNI